MKTTKQKTEKMEADRRDIQASVHCRKDKIWSWSPTKVEEIILQGKVTECRLYKSYNVQYQLIINRLEKETEKYDPYTE